ncbi:MAG: hypothetical protein ACK55I_31660, partial [bacterium]
MPCGLRPRRELPRFAREQLRDAFGGEAQRMQADGRVRDFPVGCDAPVAQRADRYAFEQRPAPGGAGQLGLVAEDVARVSGEAIVHDV